MKKWIHSSNDLFAMSNLNPKRTNLPVIIWADHSGVDRAVLHRDSPRIKITKDNVNVAISIEENPKILVKSNGISAKDMKDIQKGIDYVARNYDIFLKHYLDTDFSFDDDDLKEELKSRGDYR